MRPTARKCPVLHSGWYDDARGTIDYTDALERPKPFQRIVMGAGAHKGIDYVDGDFGPEARIDPRLLQLRWFDHYLKGKDNGVDREPPVDMFVFGDNPWRKERRGRSRAHPKWFLVRRKANTGAGDGVLDTMPPNGAPADTFTYDPASRRHS